MAAAKFELAAEEFAAFTKSGAKTSNDDLGEVYGLYKQATVGDVNIDRPGILNQKARGKWDAWNSKKGMTADDAKVAYVTKVASLLPEDAAANLK
mmetsp:Transcript_29869/g.33942  ORF Transcript_29869/g.33942 Transcript_29869/m.33942 type:complete len:95 (-) Transcript_29869:394-678(-)